MAINHATIEVERTKSRAPGRVPTHKTIAIGATAAIAALVTLIVFTQRADHQVERPTQLPAHSGDDVVRDLVDRGLIPIESLQPLRPAGDDVVRDLVDRGLIPSESLQPAAPSRDDIVQDLVDRGLVPAATPDDLSRT